MKYAGSKPPTASNASRRTSMQDPDSQPASRSVGTPRSRRYAAVHGLDGHHQPHSACPMPRPSEGSCRADG